ncbi:hypothetical protein B5M42_001850 [Paenibacillus athensensis]|uniref:Uncharacterized protein n=1 Tax=Paenibacillus athensensis TaxID=1967502 RepID=A0A4Y8QAP2_9BACL|nr:hypothetical protein [Paenibacillus athensensis]MCD1257580.1 hypothetical protein [Paenibacillus athensensis]
MNGYLNLISLYEAMGRRKMVGVWLDGSLLEQGLIEKMDHESVRINGGYYLIRNFSFTWKTESKEKVS